MKKWFVINTKWKINIHNIIRHEQIFEDRERSVALSGNNTEE